MNVNFNSAVKFINSLLPYLETGHIAVTASVASICDGGTTIASIGPLMAAYTASKHALFGYLSSMRQELKRLKKKTTISISCPYAINTGMFDGYATKTDKLLPILDEKYVADRLIREYLAKK